MPEINDAVEITQQETEDTLVVEVAQHLGDDTVRCIAMGPTDGLVRGMDAVATGGTDFGSGWRSNTRTYLQRTG